jgi:receptor-binding and translocation channel-forming TcA subunit of Tc toxin/ABC toxin-like protein/neuraminidase-like protein/PA14 domain-containing protein
MSPSHGRTVRGSIGASSFSRPASGRFDDLDTADRCEVTGQVRGPVPEAATVRAVLVTLHERVLDEHVVGEALADEAGRYRILYQCPPQAAESDTSLVVRLYSSSGDLVGQSAPLLSPPRQARINVRPGRPSEIPSEYALLDREIADALETGASAIEGAEETVIGEVAEWLDIDADRLALFERSRALEDDTGLPASMFYAMGRSGLGTSLDDLVEVPIHELRTTLHEAIADRIVDAEPLGNVDALVDQLGHQVIEHAVRADREPAEPGLQEILAAADLPQDTITRVLRQYQSRSGDVSTFWDAWGENGEAEALGEDNVREIGIAIRLGEVLGPDQDLLRRMHELRREGRWTEPKDLSAFTFDDWCELLEDLEGSYAGAEGTGESDEDAHEQIEARAETILDTLEEKFPNEFIRRRLIGSDELSPGAQRVLERASDHNLLEGSIRTYAESRPDLLEGFDSSVIEDVLDEVEAVERISRVTDRADEVAVLVGSGMESAMDIASTPRRQFIAAYAPALGGRAQASRVHAQAQQTAAGSKLAAVRLLQSIQHMPHVLGPAPEIKGMPDARTLFQAAGGFCDCEHCGSVYSPAAYLVDLLRYLDVSSPERLEKLKKNRTAAAAAAIARLGQFQPLDVLLGRRPDLAHIPLTCENTQTALPYIDLVNELLEAFLTGGSAAFDTGKTPADVLRAVPQHLSREAYTQLQTAVHPLSLPYHQPLALARAYLGHLGVTRLDLIQTLGKGPDSRDWIVAESLSMSPEEFGMVARAPSDLWRHFGLTEKSYAGVSFVDVLKQAPAFLEATGITFQSLIDLVSTRFVNADNKLHLDTPSADCNPDTVTIAGLDEARLSRMVRLIRLQRRIGWPFATLDRALIAAGATDLDAGVLEKLATARDLAKELNRPVVELLALWGPMDTWGKDNQFERLLMTRAVMWRTQDEKVFQLRPDRTELAETGDSLDAVASALLAAFRITSEELTLIRTMLGRRGAEPRLNLGGLSAVYRVVALARAMQLRIAALDLLLRLVPAEADPFRAGDPAATRRFVRIVNDIQATDFTPEGLAYLFRHEWDARRNPAPLPAQVESVLNNIRRGLADAFAETSRPAEATGDTLRQKLAMFLDPALVDAAVDILDPRSTSSPEARREFFDRHLARVFPDAAAAATKLLPAVPDQTREALDARWRATITFVLDHLLPLLRTRQLRGSIVHTLADTLGLSVPAAARLLDQVLRSRDRQGEPLLRDFLALLGTGLTGAYFSNRDLTGEPAVVRIDPELAFSWAGAAPADGVPGRDFSARWTGRLAARTKAAHTFYVQTDGALRFSITVDGTERVLIDQPAATGRIAEHTSQPINLDPRQLAEIRIEYRNQGGPATLTVQVGTGPAAKQAIPTPTLYPANGLASFAPVEQSYRRLHKVALLLTGFGVTDAQLEWLTADPPFLNLDALPMEKASDADAIAMFRRWRQLASLYALRKKLPRSNVDLFEVFRTQTVPDALERLTLATGWTRATVDAFVGPDGFAIESVAALRSWSEQSDEPALVRLARAMEMQRRVGVSPATLMSWANTTPDADTAASIVQAVKARYDEPRWLDVARGLNDPLRAERRDALVAYLLPRMHERGIRNRDQLFEYFLIDVDMNPCMLTSRIRQAIGSVQTFFQRCLMNLEPKVSPRIIDDGDWKWLKYYRVWEANRKVFLYPENWIEPELRDDKSPLFQVMERTILQQEITHDNVEAAYAEYLEGLDEIARLDVRAVWFEERATHRMVARPAPKVLQILRAPWSEWDQGTYHVFARTFNAPHVWYYRRLQGGRTWTPWEKIEAEIEGEHLVPVVFNRRLHLFWTMFREVNRPPPPLNRDDKGPPPPVKTDWEIQIAYTVYDRGKWSRKRISSGLLDGRTIITGGQQTGTQVLPPSAYTLRATVSEHGDLPQLRLHVYCRATNNSSHEWLAAREVRRLASFELDGCNGALVPERKKVRPGRAILQVARARRGAARNRANAVLGNPRRPPGTLAPFHLSAGGTMNAPTGYHVDGMGFASAGGGGALLAMSTGDARGVAVALPAPKHGHAEARIIPVVNPSRPEAGGLYPFFFQDRFRSYFVRPITADWRPATVVAVPILSRQFMSKRTPVRAVAPRGAAPQRRQRGGRGRREDIDEILDIDLAPEAWDAWEDEQDEAWHPDDAAEARPARERTRPPKPKPAAPTARPASAPRPAGRRGPAATVLTRPAPRQFVLKHQAGFQEQRLQFTPFEHPDTCRFLSTLKARGIAGLLDLTTTRPPEGRDHRLQADGTWARRAQTWFQQRYGLGPLVFTRKLPHLDVGFEAEHPYAGYNWELFFHAPLQIAVRLAKDGRHEEAQRWFHYIFDPTSDSTVPSPKRYWQFAPFFENNEYDSARALMQLLSYSGKDDRLIERQTQVRHQLSAWWEKPFSPHVIARLRIAAYQKAVVMKYIDNLVEWGDKLFRRDTMESIQEATQIYILASNILGPRPEKIPPIVEREPLTFDKMRKDLNLFSNLEVRLENLQVRRPFRINAQPEVGGATAVLGMATQYFCTPPNPQLDKYWDTVADRLFKIRNCMNIQGIVRQLPLFDPPIDPGLLVRAAAAGVDLGSVIASLNAPPPHYRFRFLQARAVRLAEEIRTFGAMTLQVLEQRDAEGLASLRAANETTLLESVRDIRKKQVRQVEEALAELNLSREHVDMQMQHLNAQLQTLMNPQELAQQNSLTAAKVYSAIAEGIDLVSKVMHAIPEFQAGAAGGFSSPFITTQLGGQMLGDVASAFASSYEKITSKHETEADMAAIQAEFQRRKEEWQNELELLTKEKAQVEKRIAEAQLKLEISAAELRRHDVEVENSKKVEGYLRDKYTNQQLYGWMLGQLSGVYFRAYKAAFDAAQQAERAFRFERGDASSSFIEFSYWDSLKNGLFAGERLLVDLRRMEAAYVEGDRRALEVTRHISLRQDYPLALLELLATGRCQIAVTEALLDGDFPGHYFRRIKTVSLTATGTLKPLTNVNCTLTLLENRIRTDANASGSYAPAADADDSRFLVNVMPVQAVATSKPDADAGLFQLRFDDDRYLPFEGAGAISTWRIELRQADNTVDLSQLGDIVLTIAYTARTGGAVLEAAARADREKGLARGGLKPEPNHLVSLKRDVPSGWKKIEDAQAGQEVEVILPLDPGVFSGRYRNLDLRIERVTTYALARAALGTDALKLRLDPPKGSGTPVAGWAPPWPQSRVLSAGADASGPAGTWKLAVSATGARVSEIIEDLVLVFDLRARKA